LLLVALTDYVTSLVKESSRVDPNADLWSSKAKTLLSKATDPNLFEPSFVERDLLDLLAQK